MSLLNCSCRCNNNCTIFAIIASVIIGVVTTLLKITAVITISDTFLWVVFGIAIGALFITLAIIPQFRGTYCVCNALSLLLSGILGAMLLSLVLLAFSFEAASVAGAIFAGLLLLSFSLMITSAACLIRHLSECENN